MKPGARAQAAIDILDEIARTGRPADQAVRGWGRAHRFAGSRDRAAIRDLVFAVFRARARLALQMESEAPRALVLAALAEAGETADAIAAAWDGEGHNPPPPSAEERAALTRALPDPLPLAVEVNCPDWVLPLVAGPEAERVAELRALDTRAPVDLRVNSLRTTRDKALRTLRNTDLKGRELPTFEPTPFAPLGIRVTGPDGGPPALDLQALKPYGDGRVEVQDEGSQIAAALVGAQPGETVVDLCTGAGGKTLALAAAMENKGQVFACDVDGGRLEEARKRIQRAHVRNAQTHKLPPAWLEAPDWPAPLAELAGKADRVVLDVPCSGSGAWRRSPDARWRLERDWLDRTLTLQAALAERALDLVRPGGWLVYITCSIFECENQNQIKILLDKSDKLDEVDMAARWATILGAPAPDAVRDADGFAGGLGLSLSPRRSATDGFFIAAVQRLA